MFTNSVNVISKHTAKKINDDEDKQLFVIEK